MGRETTRTFAKVDVKKALDCFRARAGEFRVLDVPALRYLMVDGRGDPNTAPAYAAAIGALYPVAYTTKFASRRELGRDYVVPPLEALWWAPDMDAFTTARDKARWCWTVMLVVPDWVSPDLVADARARASARHPSVDLDQVRLERLDEGRCVQTLHVGSYDDEAEVLAELHDRVIPNAGLRMTGKHHEIYLSDPRRVEASRLRTILRQPVAEA
ncbi:GyrI-like domain-containing protein [Nocardioides sp.]|uniref:GyrI-like domain-containing protein n=1 Tax=Nocardioides sp. TaxID=35761 RepID=UPI00271C08AF|nr:GyrI-like domain-containing protein [Nocardioides sp.]MDO9456023.1 GyrI-like domain-containing protein [Nocardioides sp.]